MGGPHGSLGRMTHIHSNKNKYLYIYIGSSSLVVLIGSHSLCNSFVVNQFLFFFSHQMDKIPFVVHPRSNESNLLEKKVFIFFISKIYSHVTQKWRPLKREWRYPTACVGSYFIPDENIQTYLICLQSCNTQKHQKANFRPAEYVCVQ